MTNEELILQKLDAMEAALTGQLAAVKEEIATLNQKQRVLSVGQDELLERQKKMTDRQNQLDKIAQEHSDEIAALVRRVDALAEIQENIIWNSKNGSRLALDRQRVYEMFDDYGIDRSLGLLLLEAGHKICVENTRGGLTRTRTVRPKGGNLIRAVVIYDGTSNHI